MITLTRKVKSEADDPGWFLEQSNSQGRSLHLSAELKRLPVQLAALSEVSRHGRGEIKVDTPTSGSVRLRGIPRSSLMQ